MFDIHTEHTEVNVQGNFYKHFFFLPHNKPSTTSPKTT